MPDDFLTVDQVAQRLALPPEMIRRRIESGDIPVHWIEADGKLEMRVAAEDVGGFTPTAPPAPTFGAPADPVQPSGELRPVAGEPAAEEWADLGEPEYPQGLWSPVAEVEDEEVSPWGVSTEDDGNTAAEPDNVVVPVWRPDPATWEDEPLEPAESGSSTVEYAQAAAPYDQPPPTEPPAATDPAGELEGGETESIAPTSSSFFMPEPEAPAFSAPPAPAFGFSPRTEYQELSAEAVEFEEMEESSLALETRALEPDSGVAGEVAPPSALVASQTADAGSMAINSIDARELVAGLFERWERALEQRIQAEQRLRFEAELEQRMRQVRDLRQELDQTRKAQAAQLAEREREMMDLRNKVRELEQAPRSRGLFRR